MMTGLFVSVKPRKKTQRKRAEPSTPVVDALVDLGCRFGRWRGPAGTKSLGAKLPMILILTL
jgi:hypothetical protein